MSVEWKLDGARSRSTARATTCGSSPATSTRSPTACPASSPSCARSRPRPLVLDGEAIGWGEDELPPTAFQDTMSRFGRDEPAPGDRRRRRTLARAVLRRPPPRRRRPARPAARRPARRLDAGGRRRGASPASITADADEAAALRRRRPRPRPRGRHGQGARRRPTRPAGGAAPGARSSRSTRSTSSCSPSSGAAGGARGGCRTSTSAPATPTGGFVMVGKTFKGLTDELLTWQTERFLALEDRARRPRRVRPARAGRRDRPRRRAGLDPLPGRVALRFARVRGYRDDKAPADADTIDTVRAMLPGAAHL